MEFGNSYYYLIHYINKFWEISLFIDPSWGIIQRNWRVGNNFLFPRGTAPVSLGNKKLLPTLHKKWKPLNFGIQIWTIMVFLPYINNFFRKNVILNIFISFLFFSHQKSDLLDLKILYLWSELKSPYFRLM